MDHFYVQTFLVLCLVLSLAGAALWVCYLFASAIMAIFPYVFGVILGSAIYCIALASLRSRNKGENNGS